MLLSARLDHLLDLDPAALAPASREPTFTAFLRLFWNRNGLSARVPGLFRSWIAAHPVAQPLRIDGARDVWVGNPLPIEALLSDGRGTQGLRCAGGTVYRLREASGEYMDWRAGIDGLPVEMVAPGSLAGRTPALRFIQPHDHYRSCFGPGSIRRRWLEEDRMRLLWLERLLRHGLALSFEARGIGPADAIWSCVMEAAPSLSRMTEGYPEFDPNQPRDGQGRWTDTGSRGGSPSASSADDRPGREHMRFLVDPSNAQAGSGSTYRKPDSVWSDSGLTNEFREKIDELEMSNGNYAARNSTQGGVGALGRYQLRKWALMAGGYLDENIRWTGKDGINSAEDFLASPVAQEMAMNLLSKSLDDEFRLGGMKARLGKTIVGFVAPFKITEAGLAAVGHRAGGPVVIDYIKLLEKHEWDSNRARKSKDWDPKYDMVETRLRKFSSVEYRK
ncbi:MAG TPA: hypothetical protein VED40_05935 [Azospirillaceae bacterium]|nr:hypothetical protein [Azospirillaceae bacterium]